MKTKSTLRTEKLISSFDHQLYTMLKHDLLIQKLKQTSRKVSVKLAA